MKPFEEQYKEALKEIEEKIKTSKKDKDLLVQLKKDREYIINYLYPKLTKKTIKTDFDLGITDSEEEISDMVISNQLYFCFLSSFLFIKKNDKKIEKLFNSFIEDDEFGLKKVYDEIISYDGLICIETKDNHLGCNTFIPSIKRNFIEIKKTKKIYEISSKVHELGHAKTNIESYIMPFSPKYNSFLESYSIFLEMVFADYLINNGKRKEGYQLKFLIFDNIKDITKQLYDELEEYDKDSEVKNALKYFFEFNYMSLKGYYLALHFYFLYQSNPKESLEIINNFIKEVKLLDDNELIKKFNLNKECFSNENVYKLYRELKEEKNKIKSRKAE